MNNLQRRPSFHGDFSVWVLTSAGGGGKLRASTTTRHSVLELVADLDDAMSLYLLENRMYGMTSGAAFGSTGYHVRDEFLSAEGCEALLAQIASYREKNVLPRIHRPMKGRSLHYSVIDGERIQRDLENIWTLYQGKMNEFVNKLTGISMEPLANSRAGVNVNIMPPGRSEYRWHYDRTTITAILYLNRVEGGETVLYPNYRILLEDPRRVRLQSLLDRALQLRVIRGAFGKKVVVEPRPGRLVVMRANRCWHSVRGVRGSSERINVILSYDVPGAEYPMERGLDTYLYTQEKTASSDPNYAR